MNKYIGNPKSFYIAIFIFLLFPAFYLLIQALRYLDIIAGWTSLGPMITLTMLLPFLSIAALVYISVQLVARMAFIKGRSVRKSLIASFILSPPVVWFLLLISAKRPERRGEQRCPECNQFTPFYESECKHCSHKLFERKSTKTEIVSGGYQLTYFGRHDPRLPTQKVNQALAKLSDTTIQDFERSLDKHGVTLALGESQVSLYDLKTKLSQKGIETSISNAPPASRTIETIEEDLDAKLPEPKLPRLGTYYFGATLAAVIWMVYLGDLDVGSNRPATLIAEGQGGFRKELQTYNSLVTCNSQKLKYQEATVGTALNNSSSAATVGATLGLTYKCVEQ